MAMRSRSLASQDALSSSPERVRLTSAKEGVREDPAVGTRVRLKVEGMTCSACSGAVEAALLARAGCGSVRTCESIVASKARVALVVDTPAPPPYVSALATRRTVGCPCSTPTRG